MGNEEVMVKTKDWATPVPAGLVAVAVACFCYFGLLNGHVDGTAAPLIGCWLLGAFVVQLIVGLVGFKSGDVPGGNLFLVFAAFFMLTGCIAMFVTSSGAALDARIDGWAWLAIALALLLWTPAFLKPFGLLSVIVLSLDVALPFLAVINLGYLPASLLFIPGYALLVAGLIALYVSGAIVVNTALGKDLYPLR